MVAEAASNVEARVERRGGKITIADDLGEVIGRRSTIAQVVSNLLSNATKFVSPGETPEIRVWTEKHQDCEDRSGQRTLRLIVEDKGIGIEPSYLERIFKPFERLNGAESFPGTGIGLAIVKKGIERMGGSVGVDSEPGRGSRFWIELPSA